MAKMKEATSGGKKRGIEQVIEDKIIPSDSIKKEKEDAVIQKDVEVKKAEVVSEVCNYSECFIL